MVLFLILLILFEMKFWLVISMFFSLYGVSFYFSTQVTCYAFYFSSFFKGEKGDCYLSQGF